MASDHQLLGKKDNFLEADVGSHETVHQKVDLKDLSLSKSCFFPSDPRGEASKFQKGDKLGLDFTFCYVRNYLQKVLMIQVNVIIEDSLIPLFLIIGSGGIGAALYVMRLAVFNPDVCWDKKNNPEPWNKLAPNDQYKVK
ncbi:hypothetical protein CIB84_003953 [Bambusicola thoracicus]|uniref:Cytochrome c oxidase subunit NDUFA4 n=1 Tax=Bambusicola thoracicus TaxID=9083 RepID=A0A2P4T7F9_BAMTH|nr:hypothetical protein CIB84_003953 [Bambusicola thoracicus]